MPWGIIASVAGPLVGGLLGGNASGDAADAQIAAGNAANATQLQMFNQARQDQEPWRRTGETALNRLAVLMGLDVPSSSADTSAIRSRLLPQFTSQSQPVPRMMEREEGGGPPGFTFDQGTPQVDEAGLSAAIQREQGTSQPGPRSADFGSLMKPFGMEDYQADPGYGFRLSEGMKALERSAAARGGLLSGAMLKGINRYAQDSASAEYGNAYNRYNQNQSNQYNRLAGISGTGQTTAQQIGSQGIQTGQGIAANQVGIGNARASGYVGGANALSGGLNNAYGAYNQNRLLDILSKNQQNYPGAYPSYGSSPLSVNDTDWGF